MNQLEMITESIIREALGEELVDQAYVALSAGKVIDRTYLTYGEIYARWDGQLKSPEMHVWLEGETLLMDCSCPQSEKSICQHIAALLTAWVTSRESFALQEAGKEMDEYGLLVEQAVPARTAPVEKPFDPVQDYHDVLDRLTLVDLREVARRRKVPISGSRKGQIVDTLTQALARPEKLVQDWPSLSEQARLVLGLLPFLPQGGGVPLLRKIVETFGVNGGALDLLLDELQKFGLIVVDSYGWLRYPLILPVWLPPDAAFALGSGAAPLDVNRLRIQAARSPLMFYQAVTRLLLLFQAASAQYLAREDTQARALRKQVPFLQGWPVDVQDQMRLARESKPLLAIRQQGVRINPAPPLLTEEARRKLSVAANMEPEVVDFIVHLLVSLRLLKITPGKPVQFTGGIGLALIQAEPILLAKELFGQYAGLDTWTEFDLVLARPKALKFTLTDYNRGDYSFFLKTAAAQRDNLLMLLRRVPTGQWFSLSKIVERMALVSLTGSLQRLLDFGMIEVAGSKINLVRPGDWQKLFSVLAQAVLSGPLYWQGIVDLAWDQDRLVGFRLTDLGGALLAQRSDYRMPERTGTGPALKFSPKGDLLLNLDSASGELISLLMRLGDVEVNAKGEIQVHLTLAGAGQAFESGWKVDHMLDVLAESAGQAVPASLADPLGRWWDRFGSIQIYQDVALIELNDDYAFDELMAGTALPRYLLYRFNPRLIAVRPDGVDALRDEMVRKGYTPKVA